MVVFPNCKINLGLNILRNREDGFHDLETVFYPVPLKDALEVIHLSNSEKTTSMHFTSSGLLVDGSERDNLCVKAYDLLKKDFPDLPAASMHLHKAIPMGAGLGGGSADAAFALQLLNEKFRLGLSKEQLIIYALQLGSDCPFFIINQPCLGAGRGELLEEIGINLSGYQLLLVNPGIHVDTGWAFTQLLPLMPVKSIRSIIQQDISSWKTELNNDFEEVVFRKHPEIKLIKEKLYELDATYASMSGSGSTVYGLFEKDVIVNSPFPASYFFKKISL